MIQEPRKILIIQTAFIGDVVLATPLIETLHQAFPEAQLDFLVRKGNEGLLQGHPYLREVKVWDKKQDKFTNMWWMIRGLRQEKYDWVINCQRFFSTGLIAGMSKGKWVSGFNKNPLSFLFHKRTPHVFGEKIHEVDRNLSLLPDIVKRKIRRPKLYPSLADKQHVAQWQQAPYICVAPTSVWFTKQFPAAKWVSFLKQIPFEGKIYLLGAPSDREACDQIMAQVPGKDLHNLCGELSLVQSAALMEKATMNYVNDSAPMHFASAMNAPVTAVYCSTVPEFGFGPLSEQSHVVEVKEALACRPCGLHGFRACPKKHFHCALHITNKQLNAVLKD